MKTKTMTFRGSGCGRVRRTVAVLLLALVGSACSGPREPLSVGHFAYRSDIVLGAPPVVMREAEPVALPPTAVAPRIVIVLVSPPPKPPVLPTVVVPDLGPCPAASPIAAPKIVAPNNVQLPPAPASYAYRSEGVYEVSGANAGKGTVELESTRTVENVVDNGDGTFDYDIRARLDDTTTITTYHLEPLEVDGEGIVEIVRVVTQEHGDGDDVVTNESTFAPATPMKILEFPIVTGDNWTAQGVDPDSGHFMAYNAVVDKKQNVDACGEVLDTFTVQVSGTFAPCPEAPPEVPPLPIDPSENCDVSGQEIRLMDGTSSTFTATYQFATQFGGLVVQDFSRVFTDSADSTMFRETTATINEVPLAPALPPIEPTESA